MSGGSHCGYDVGHRMVIANKQELLDPVRRIRLLKASLATGSKMVKCTLCDWVYVETQVRSCACGAVAGCVMCVVPGTPVPCATCLLHK